MKQNQTTLYNIIFPVWFLAFFPLAWLVVVPANFLIDSLVICLGMKYYGVQNSKQIYKKTIVKIVCFGFLSDIIGAIVMMTSQMMSDVLPSTFELFEKFINPVMYNPFDGIFALLWVLGCMAIASLCIYWLNVTFTFRKTELELAIRKKLSLVLAVCTTPVLFLLPSEWFW